MIELTKKEMSMIVDNHRHFEPYQISYWYRRINERMNFLKPLLNELDNKGLNIYEISEKLSVEVSMNKLLIDMLSYYIKNNECGVHARN